MPIRALSHMPARARKTGSGASQLCRSVDRDIQTSAWPPTTVRGRWNSTKWSPTRRGSRAAFLSSGGQTTPMRSTERKSVVVASETAGPVGP